MLNFRPYHNQESMVTTQLHISWLHHSQIYFRIYKHIAERLNILGGDREEINTGDVVVIWNEKFDKSVFIKNNVRRGWNRLTKFW